LEGRAAALAPRPVRFYLGRPIRRGPRERSQEAEIKGANRLPSVRFLIEPACPFRYTDATMTKEKAVQAVQVLRADAPLEDAMERLFLLAKP
jgi:hypothetical protein